ncbi:MAG: sugar phosphate nucleotidyltransferase [Eubacteriales bacterium]|nr:sugar phosphate nucleotidyltransferase [Eubacteriales bacterium]
MKCIVLAGGRGDRLWPLSRKNYPKQFITIDGSHSIFQETIARNMAFCDEFVIVTNREYQFIVENQLKAFQGLTWRLVMEEEARKTTAAILLSCLEFPLSELIFIVPSDHLIQGEQYKDAISEAGALARQGGLVTIGMPVTEPEVRFGYIRCSGQDVEQFVEKPNEEQARQYQASGRYLINSGMFLFRNGDLLQEVRTRAPEIMEACERAFADKLVEKGKHIFYRREVLEQIPAQAIEKTVFEGTCRGKVVHGAFDWQDVGSLEDLGRNGLTTQEDKRQAQQDCENTLIINRASRSIVVASHLKDVTIVNTDDAVYVGKNGASEELKELRRDNPELQSYFDMGQVIYKPWGTYEILSAARQYVVRKVVLSQGRTIYAHKHARRTEHWIIVSGRAKIALAGREQEYGSNDSIEIPENTVHQISNVGDIPLVFMEISTGQEVMERDLISVESRDLNEAELGYRPEPFVKLLPAFKDYLWGGTKLKEKYGKKCDYDCIAESWELSAHEAGQSIVASGRYKGRLFADYLSRIGRENCGWKCQSVERFPILIKLIDAHENLSVQVHPGDDYALAHENEYGKNEMWYILEHEEGAGLYCGFRRDVTRDEVKAALADGSILSLLNWVPVEDGQAYYIPAGTVHAIGKGVVICEIQQSSNCTYRLYDYNRTDRYGNKRPLHVEKALEVMNYHKYEVPRFADEEIRTESYTCRVLSRCKYFESASYRIHGRMALPAYPDSFCSFLCVKGSGRLSNREESSQFRAGDSYFLPCSHEKLNVEGDCEVILTHI